MEASIDPEPRTSGIRRVVFWALLFALVPVALEGVSWLALAILEGRPVSYALIREAQRQPARDSVPQNFRRARQRGEASTEAVHPYLGYVKSGVGGLGFRSENPLQQRSEDKLVIGIGGGSVADVLAMSTAVPGLARLERVTGRRVEIVNTAIAGYKQPQQLMAFAYLLVMGAQFDVFVNLDGFNDVALHYSENGPKGVHPIYPRNWYARAESLPDPAITHLVGAVAHFRAQRKSWANELMRPSWRWSMTAALVWRAGDRYLSGKVGEADAELRAYLPPERTFQLTGPDFVATEDADVASELVRIWEESSLQLYRLAESNGIAYFHFLQPNQYVPDSKPLTAREMQVAFDADHPYRFGVLEGYPRLREAGAALTRQGVHFQDLTNVFEGVDQDVYVDNCCHFGENGYVLVWDAIVDAMLATPGALPRSASLAEQP